MSDQVAQNKRRSLLLLGVPFLLVTVVIGAIGLLLGLGGIGIVVALAAAVAVTAASWWGSERVVLAVSRATPADPTEHARLHNLVEGLCVASGLPKPRIYVIDDAAPNAFAIGRSPQHAAIAVTTGLLAVMSRVELEAVLAHELSHIKNDDILTATLAVTAPLLRRAVDRDCHALADVSAVQMTRYPPALISALQKLRADPATVQASSRATAHLWIEAPLHAHPPIEERIAALQEL